MSSVQPSSFSRKFTDDVLTGVILTGKELGRGSDATVVEADFEGTFCAAKQLHPTLLEDQSSIKARSLITDFEKEINLWRSLRHPHIVQLIGVCFERGSRVPTLILEKVQTSLRKYIETSKKGDIPLPGKVSILPHQVSQGLAYLHSRQPPLVHRDLSPNNILLNQDSFQTKITDFGLSRFVDPQQSTRKSTMVGTMAFLPPEALLVPPKYTQKLDIFSIGNVIIFTISHHWPDPGPNVVFEGDRAVAVEEWQRRERHTRNFTAEERTSFFPMIQSCLENRPVRRPTSLQLVHQFRQMGRKAFIKRCPDKKNSDQPMSVFKPIWRIASSVRTGVKFSGKEIGRGSDTVVVEAVYEGSLCAAKKLLYPDVLGGMSSGSQRLLPQLEKEIKTWETLRHPYIVQLMGIYSGPESRAPILIMERMQTSLKRYIATRMHNIEEVPLPDKVFILRQVCQALSYLHSLKPPLVHHGVSPDNILLNQGNLLTKLTDFGLSRIVPRSLDRYQPRVIKQISWLKAKEAYMPPEALCSPPKYTEKLDIFSFGNVILFTITHLWPEPGLRFGFEGNKIFDIEELQRRERITRTLTAEERSSFFPMIRSCLENRPDRRPTSLQLVQQMTRMEEVYPRPAQKQ